MIFDYSELIGRIKTRFKTQRAFAQAMNMSLSALNQRLNNKIEWRSRDILKACELLKIGKDEVSTYFFTLIV